MKSYFKKEFKMASFEQHINASVIATGVFIAPVFSAGLLTVNQSLIVLSLGIVGGVLPDLDSDSSRPVQIVFKILSVFLPLLFILAFTKNIPIMKLILIWLGTTILLYGVFFKIFLELTHHRGIFHSIPMGILFGELVSAFFFNILNQSVLFSLICGLFIFFGFLIHLILDEIFSVNALGLKLKHSFGTALKLYSKNNILGTLLVYGLIIVLYFYIPYESNFFKVLFDVVQNIRII